MSKKIHITTLTELEFQDLKQELAKIICGTDAEIEEHKKGVANGNGREATLKYRTICIRRIHEELRYAPLIVYAELITALNTFECFINSDDCLFENNDKLFCQECAERIINITSKELFTMYAAYKLSKEEE
jgi:hypothetical protein